jgi:hypothetical protein
MKLIDVRLDDHLLVADGVLSLVSVEAREELAREELEQAKRDELTTARRAKRAAAGQGIR